MLHYREEGRRNHGETSYDHLILQKRSIKLRCPDLHLEHQLLSKQWKHGTTETDGQQHELDLCSSTIQPKQFSAQFSAV